jgi:general secretion pathway protein L
MSSVRLLFLGGNRQWLDIDDSVIARRGEGHDSDAQQDGAALIAVAPATDVTIHWLDLPDLSLPQANAAARLMLADRLLGDAHIACGAADADGVRPVAVVSATQIRGWVATLDPDAIVPAQMIIAAPDNGLVRADLGPGAIVRGTALAMADDPTLTAMLAGDSDVPVLSREAVEASVIAAVAAPPLDLRQGAFARKTGLMPSWARVRPLAWVAVALLLVTLAIPLATISRLSMDASMRDRETAALARQAIGETVSADEAATLLRDRLAAMRGGGGGFSGTAAATIAAVAKSPNVDLTSMAFASDGILRLTARGATQAELDALTTTLRSAGLNVTPGVASMENGRPKLELQVKGQ